MSRCRPSAASIRPAATASARKRSRPTGRGTVTPCTGRFHCGHGRPVRFALTKGRGRAVRLHMPPAGHRRRSSSVSLRRRCVGRVVAVVITKLAAMTGEAADLPAPAGLKRSPAPSKAKAGRVVSLADDGNRVTAPKFPRAPASRKPSVSSPCLPYWAAAQLDAHHVRLALHCLEKIEGYTVYALACGRPASSAGARSRRRRCCSQPMCSSDRRAAMVESSLRPGVDSPGARR